MDLLLLPSQGCIALSRGSVREIDKYTLQEDGSSAGEEVPRVGMYILQDERCWELLPPEEELLRTFHTAPSGITPAAPKLRDASPAYSSPTARASHQRGATRPAAHTGRSSP